MESDSDDYIPMPVEVELGCNNTVLFPDTTNGTDDKSSLTHNIKMRKHQKHRRKSETTICLSNPLVMPSQIEIKSLNGKPGMSVQICKKNGGYYISPGNAIEEVQIMRTNRKSARKITNIKCFDNDDDDYMELPLKVEINENASVDVLNISNEIKENSGRSMKVSSEENYVEIKPVPLKVNLREGGEDDCKKPVKGVAEIFDSSKLAVKIIDASGEKKADVLRKNLVSCDFCDKALPSKQMAKHRRVHTNERPFRCTTCGMRFKQTSHLNKHQRTHNPNRPYECKTCGKTFLELSDLRIHRAVHAGTGPYKCELCPATCRSANDLTKHRRVHTNERPYNCQLCSKSFKQIGHLKTHMALHSDERPFKCNICAKTFILSGHLKVHEVLHTGVRPFKCEICDRAYASNGKLTQHKKTHLSERPFQCGFCDKAYMARCDLNVHLNKHSGATPYVCTECNMGFGRRSNLNKHILRAHPAAEDSSSK